MMTQDELDLLHAYVAETISDEGLPRLQSLLRENAEARAMLRSLCTVDVKLHEYAAANPATMRLMASPVTASPQARSGPSPRGRFGKLRPFAAAAAGLVIGLLGTSFVFAYVSPKFAAAKPAVREILSESFESGTQDTLPGLPHEPGVWSGDVAHVAAMEQGIKPRSGGKMLRFVTATFAGENARRSAWCDVYRLVDLRGQVGEGRSAVRLSANFNAVQFPAGEEYSCSVELCAMEDVLTAAPQPLALPWVRENSASTALRKFLIKGDGVWQEASAEVPVSPQTQFVLVHLAVHRRKPFPPTEPVQFGGHYVDDVKVELLTYPSKP